MKIWKNCVLFYLGGCAYMGLELLWRGWSHGSMFLAGGCCFLLLGRLDRRGLRLPLRALIGALVITAVELAAGLMWNRDHSVWDYRARPGNLWGQICPLFTLLWIPVALAAMALYRLLDRRLWKSLPHRRVP